MRHPERFKYDKNGNIAEIKCSRCNTYKDKEQFYFMKRGFYDSFCRECRLKINRKHHKKLRETVYRNARYQKPEWIEEPCRKEEKTPDGLLCPPRAFYARI